ncbi:hypothetical protein N9230_06690 [Akkermansiaceae bacterium]|nr:hypothetical protein [Akkermansiaceae bacterium]
MPILRTAVGQLTSQGNPQTGPPVWGSSRWQKIGKLLSCFHYRSFFQDKDETASAAEQFLFVPLFDRDYCLDACGLVMRAMQEASPGVGITVVAPPVISRSQNKVPEGVTWREESEISRSWPCFRMLLRGGAAYLRFVAGARRNREHLQYLTEGFGKWRLKFLLKFLIHYRFVASGATWLRRENIGRLVTINDTVESGGWLFGAAKVQGLKTHLIMHGVPGPLGWPFLADQCWVWGERSRQALIDFGAPPERLSLVGHLESELGAHSSPRERSELTFSRLDTPKEKKTLVIFSQICANHSWKTDVFSEIYKVVIEVLSGLAESWKLRIRRHPSESVEIHSAVTAACQKAGIEVELTGANLLDNDLAGANFALSVNSTALLSSLLAGIPSAQYYPDHFRSQVGSPFFSKELVFDSVAGLAELLERCPASMTALLADNVHDIFSNRGRSAEVAADHVLENYGPPHS